MSVALRILLLIGALAMLMFVVKSIRKSRIQMKDALVWMLIALLIAIFGIFPSVPMWIAGILGIDSAANMVFLILLPSYCYVFFHWRSASLCSRINVRHWLGKLRFEHIRKRMRKSNGQT